ncbi:hypothetical protein HZC31_05370 [Candidatus Woesearchaeota archaeon]|nr:hypothetical protein [Candidatus Woesearchaeota archaeon]
MIEKSIEITHQHLEKIPSHKTDVQLYKLFGPNGSQITRYLASTPETRAICNQPEIFGMEFTEKLHTAIRKTLEVLPEVEQFKQWPDYETNVISILRGGLNFGIREALAKAYGYNKHSTTYLISQRTKDPLTNKWSAEVQTYKKITIPKVVNFFLGDVIGTGTSLREALAALDKVIEQVNVRTVKRFTVMTFGCYRAEKVLEEYDAQLRKKFPDYQGTTIIYFEGKFKLVNNEIASGIRLTDSGTDFLRRDCILTPEFALSQYEQVYFPLERCTIYDAGSRAFDILLYKKELQEYWARMLSEANNGYTLFDALQERYPDLYDSKESFIEEKKRLWHGISDSMLQQMWLGYEQRWNPAFIEYAKSPEALKKICILRLEMIQNHEC